MLFQKLAIISALTALVAGQDIGRDDISQQCTAICAPVVELSRNCDNTTENDANELNCICTAPNANTLIPACDACVAQFPLRDNDNDNDNDDPVPDVNDVREILTRCSFTTTSFNPASATVNASIGSNTTAPTGSIMTTTSGSVVMTTTVATATPSVGQQTTNAAPARTAGAAIGLGALGFALGML